MHSSLSLTSETAFDKTELRKAKTIVTSLLQNQDCYDFRAPVDWKGLNLTDYPTIVHNPMDLGTVSDKLKHEKYETIQHFLDDIQLVWDNCKLYNLPGSWFYQTAEKLERSFKKQVRNYFPDISIVIPQKPHQEIKNKPYGHNNILLEDEGVTYFQKLQFLNRVQNMNADELEDLVKWLGERNANLIHEVNQERSQIVVDNFTRDDFEETIRKLTMEPQNM